MNPHRATILQVGVPGVGNRPFVGIVPGQRPAVRRMVCDHRRGGHRMFLPAWLSVSNAHGHAFRGAETNAASSTGRWFQIRQTAAAARPLFLEVLAKEVTDLAEGFTYFGDTIVAPVLRVRLAFVDLEERVDAQVA